MPEADAIDEVDDPVTVSTLVSDLRELGVGAGDTLLVHSSLSSLGWVAGGPPAVVDALQEVLTEDGTLVMPTHSFQYSDPSWWENPPVPDHWVDIIREERPPFRPEVTPTRGMGAIPECLRNYPGVRRSNHPTSSFAAWGAGAEEVTEDHSPSFGLGDGSPLARVYDRGGKVLLVGVGYDRNTSLHLAEMRADIDLEEETYAFPLVRDGERVSVEYTDATTSTEDFEAVGEAFEAEIGATKGTVGAAECTLIDQPSLVDFAESWFEANR
ncbi:aminoglycoside N(3)-acetyltransferase [Haloferax namakaokahaiae]|uniref:Aminoglycoside N(3)-acetyltransferase n=1 Tax=Haloferax namakaokahaiae TaxID=1748331 RepID=A0ABD5ZET3_9EURY